MKTSLLKKEEKKVTTKPKEKKEEEAAPMLPQDDFLDLDEPEDEVDRDQITEDLQKELEAKFDELFGAFDDE